MGGFYRKGVPGAGLGTLWAGLASTLDWPRAGWLLSALGTSVDLCHRLSCGTRSGADFPRRFAAAKEWSDQNAESYSLASHSLSYRLFRVAMRLPRNSRYVGGVALGTCECSRDQAWSWLPNAPRFC